MAAAHSRRGRPATARHQHPDVFWGFIASMYVGNLMLLALNLPLVAMFVNVLRFLRRSIADQILHHRRDEVTTRSSIWIMLVMGVVGYLLQQVRLRPSAAGAWPRHRTDLRDEVSSVSDQVERRSTIFFERPIRPVAHGQRGD